MSGTGKCSGFLTLLSAIVLAAGVAVSGYLVSYGLINHGSYNDFVTVKGLATQDVEADLVIWPIKHVSTGNELPLVQQEIEANTKKIINFLRAQKLLEADIVTRKIEVTDLLAQSYRQNNVSQARYIVSETLILRTDKVDAVEKANQNLGDILKEGISLSRENGSGNPEYIFTKLNDVKPAMIAEATKNAREAAEQFASDTGVQVGHIKNASQGVFQILPRDSENSYQERQERYKTVRVVSTLSFYLD